ncbi:MAG: hypothetical protein WC699_12595 [Bacteroidales bacterium]|jgi:hypothetical protein
MKTKIMIIALMAIAFTACEKYGLGTQSLGGSQSPIGEVNTSFTFSGISGISNASARVTELTGGVSKIDFTGLVTDSKLLALANYLSGVTVSGNTISGSVSTKFTSEGIETVHEGGKLILVKYDAKVGDKYTLKTGNETLTREVKSKSVDDDYYWGGMMIKTIAVEETGHSEPGISKMEYMSNHKFGLVGVKLHFTDGTSKTLDIYSSKQN